ncbi:MAG: transporter substrate-binding domain-containing protein [Nitrospina sp.]|jgi:polar amino acid transport system substrate-binding protein|nr:transporter substrate-binding domain-containing protein [Nitrospina sp.]
MRPIYTILKLLLILFFFGAGGCQQDPSSSRENLARVVVAMDATFIPMSFMNSENQLDGFEVDLLKELAQDANFVYELVNVEWGGLFGGLVTKKFDLVISSVGIIEERKKKMAFSIPYLQSGVAVLARDDIKGIDTLEDLEKQSAIVGAQINTTSYYFLQKYPGIKIKTFEKFGHAVIDLANRGVDAVVGDSVQANYYFKKNKDLMGKARFLGSRMTSEFYGIVIRKEDKQLKSKIDASLNRLLKNGTISRLHQKWELGEFATVPVSDG